jgi:uncharacterized membrane protein
MNIFRYPLYSLALSLWVGGMALFTFVVTPMIFKSYPRDMAGEIVGKLFPSYFSYNLIITALALILLFMLASDRSNRGYRLSLLLLIAALLINVFITFKLHPETVAAKQRIASFERLSPESPERKVFAKLHGLSAALNLLLLADGVVLLVINPLFKK